MTSKRGVTETKTQYGPKWADRVHFDFIDPFSSKLGRPSSAPIAHRAQRQFEERKRAEERAMLMMAEQVPLYDYVV